MSKQGSNWKWALRQYTYYFALAAIFTVSFRSMAVTGVPGGGVPTHDSYKDLRSDVHIFGVDDRVPMTSSDYPWGIIGALFSETADGKSFRCTATLVGRKWIITAAHCLNWVGETETATFYPNYKNGAFTESANVLRHWTGTGKKAKGTPYDYESTDWALAELDQPLGDVHGWMGVRDIPQRQLSGTSIVLAGYSGNFMDGQTAGVSSCSIQRVFANGTFEHDCDSSGGSSGGPLFIKDPDGKYYILGINTNQSQIEPSLKGTTTDGKKVYGGYGDNGAHNGGIAARPALLLLKQLLAKESST